MTTTKDVLIAGAGPTGLTMANVLARSGVSFRVLDKKAGPVEETRALVMHAKTLELLDKLGLADWAIEEGRRLGAAVLLKEGKRAAKLSFFDDGRDERTPYPFALVYEQDRIERLLIRGLEEAGGGVEWGTELLSLTPSADGVRAVVGTPTAPRRPSRRDGSSARMGRAAR
jgi:2-polyprenyl-6-methoxyphenol hydroxylase-like FAD-dependent oxidoreductase